ncbi:hypothetical protein PRUPE_6G034200 [Prunus persica]|uniref:Uncharacterized protein n=1 Tax=Prunus persica TaxID=3760 RepID=A0A251NJN9_PRUPE|nr:hypothetical protein PRUPE_6G034200 [Prunus persica]
MEDVDDDMDDEFREGSGKPDGKDTKKGSLYYEFRRNARSVKSIILHFQVCLIGYFLHIVNLSMNFCHTTTTAIFYLID